MAASPYRTVFVDVDTQVDFMLPHGKLYVPGAEKIIPNLDRLMTFARERNLPVISSVDAHAPDDPEFQQFPAHCVKGTPGQQKIPETLLPERIVLPNEPVSLPERETERHQQWIVEKQKFDLFTNVNAPWLFENFPADQYVVFGVATEYCVRAATVGLLRMRNNVALVTDAIQAIDPRTSALQEMQEAGATLVNTHQVLSESFAPPHPRTLSA